MKINDFKTFLFPSWCDWYAYTKKAVKSFVYSLVSILYAIVSGLGMLIYNAYASLKKLVLKYPVYALGILCIVLAVLLLFNYVHFSAKVKNCEYQRDSISYQLLKIEQAFGGDTIIIGGRRHMVGNVNSFSTDLFEDSIAKK